MSDSAGGGDGVRHGVGGVLGVTPPLIYLGFYAVPISRLEKGVEI